MNLLLLDRNKSDLSVREKTGLQAFLNALAGNEGTFTPTITGSATAGVQTYTAQTGWYRAIGDICFIDIDVAISAKDVAMAGNVQVGGIPFISKNLTNLDAILSVTYNGVTLSAGYSQIMGRLVTNTQVIAINQYGSGVAPLPLPVTGLAATSSIRVSGFYFI